jgi:hypothetical protein
LTLFSSAANYFDFIYYASKEIDKLAIHQAAIVPSNVEAYDILLLVKDLEMKHQCEEQITSDHRYPVGFAYGLTDLKSARRYYANGNNGYFLHFSIKLFLKNFTNIV